MAKWSGIIGFANTVEDPDNPGVYVEDIEERNYKGDLIRVSRNLQSASNTVNDNINISNEISIIADPYVKDNLYSIRYVTFMGAKWKISNVQVNYPRLTLSIGGLYNG